MKHVFLLALAAACSSPAPQIAVAPIEHPWPMFRGRAQHDGDFGARPSPRGKLGWNVATGERIDASPVISASGRVFVATREGSVIALDLQSGAELRRARLGGSLWASPLLFGTTLVVASSTKGLVALDLQTLKPVWTVPLSAGSYSGLALWDRTLYLCAGRELLAIDAATGAVLERHRLDAASFTTPAIDIHGKRVIVGTRSGSVVAVDRKSFSVLWTARTGGRNDGSPTIAGDLVVIGSDDNALHAFELDTGARRWRHRGENWVVSTPAYASGVIYFGDDGGRLRAVLADGSEKWTAKVGDDLASSPTVIGDLVVHGAHDGKVWFWNAASGRAAFAPIDVGSPMYASPAVRASGGFVIATRSGRVVAVE